MSRQVPSLDERLGIVPLCQVGIFVAYRLVGFARESTQVAFNRHINKATNKKIKYQTALV